MTLYLLFMRNAKQTVVLFQGTKTTQEIGTDLSRQGTLTYCQADTVEQLQLLLDEQRAALIGFQASQLPLAITVAYIRTLIGLGGLIVITASDEGDAAADYLLAGADAVVSAQSASAMALLAWQTVLVRRADGFMRLQAERYDESPSPLPPPQGQLPSSNVVAEPDAWVLVEGGWHLKSPAGDTFSLTSSERFFLESFIGERNKRVSRMALLTKNASLNESSRAIDSLLSRLRRKLKQKNTHLPVKAVHGWGYSFSGLLLSEDETKAGRFVEPEALVTAMSTLRQEFSSRAQFDEQLQSERFGFSYHPVLDTKTDQIVSAVAILEWQDAQGQHVSVDRIAPYLEAIGVLEKLSHWALRRLQLEIQAWEADYEVQIPLYISLPASLLLNNRFKWERLAALGQSGRLTVVLSDLTPEMDVSALRLVVRKLQQCGMVVWACANNPVILTYLQTHVGFEGVCFDHLADTVEAQQSQDLEQILDHIQQHNWPTLSFSIGTLSQRYFSEHLGIRYMAGSVIAMDLSRDGLLLFWASRSNNKNVPVVNEA